MMAAKPCPLSCTSTHPAGRVGYSWRHARARPHNPAWLAVACIIGCVSFVHSQVGGAPSSKDCDCNKRRAPSITRSSAPQASTAGNSDAVKTTQCHRTRASIPSSRETVTCPYDESEGKAWPTTRTSRRVGEDMHGMSYGTQHQSAS